LGDEYYRKKDYQRALEAYQNASIRKSTGDLHLRIARCHYALKNYRQSIAYYNDFKSKKGQLPDQDLLNYAEVYTITGKYDTAIALYRSYLEQVPENDLILNKIWRLSNIRYLYEDSAHITINPVPFNTSYGELCATRYNDRLIFMSNRELPRWVEKVDASTNAPFYKMYAISLREDTLNSNTYHYAKVKQFDYTSPYNIGPLVLYDKGRKMAFIASAGELGEDGVRKLQLFFSEKKNEKWCTPVSFPYNSLRYSISDLAMSNDGNTLYFTSDMEGGFGGKDIYTSKLNNGKWAVPENLGSTINTQMDEAFPFLYQDKTLYFSSNGHAGMGGLDIFYSPMLEDRFMEPKNIGYPINSSYDDFAWQLDSLNRGFFTSNRKNGGYDDDIYEVEIELQVYPLTISGVVQYKERYLDKLSEARILKNAKIMLVDKSQNAIVSEEVSDENGNFSMVVPYFSTYVIKVVDHEGSTSDVPLEIPRIKSQVSQYEIVIVKDVYESTNE